MKKAEEVFGLPLFDRTKNSIRLNENGKLAAEEIRLLLKQTDEMIARVREYDRAHRTIAIGTAAAVQLPEMVGRLSRAFPEKAITTELKLPEELVEGLDHNTYQMIILPYDPTGGKGRDDRYCAQKIGEEHLMFLLPKKHKYSRRKFLTLKEMNGENFLLYSEVGFWAKIVHEKMPDSRFLVQSERYSFAELIANSVLPCFATDLSMRNTGPFKDRTAVPIEDPEVNVTYYLVCRKEDYRQYEAVFRHGTGTAG
jgi:DNA-binding transcriptional LysR family regulator